MRTRVRPHISSLAPSDSKMGRVIVSSRSNEDRRELTYCPRQDWLAAQMDVKLIVDPNSSYDAAAATTPTPFSCVLCCSGGSVLKEG